MVEAKLYYITYKYELDEQPYTIHAVSTDMEYQRALMLATAHQSMELDEHISQDDIELVEYPEVEVDGYNIELTKEN
jgi:uncharacterized protein YlxW (UPF0749 family)